MMLFLFGLFSVCWIFYKIWVLPYDYWKKRGVPHIEATFPRGSSSGFTFLNRFQGDEAIDVYNKLAPHPYGGIIVLRRPHLVLRDLNIVKHIMVKDFDYFRDRTTADNIQEPISEHIFNLPGEKWRVKRVHLGPIFSTLKIKSIFQIFSELKKDLYVMLDKLSNEGSNFDTKDTMSRFTIDFMGSWTFGIKVNSMEQPNHVLRETGPKFFPPAMTTKVVAEQMLFNFITGIEDKFRFPFVPPDLAEAVHFYTKAGIEERRKNNNITGIVDFIDTLIKLENKGTLTTDRLLLTEGSTQKISENKLDLVFDDLSAEALILFGAGFDTSSTTISCAFFELARNPSIQERLRDEIDEYMERYGDITYQALHEMPYLDQVISETLRLYPPVPVLTRKCTRDYQMVDCPDLIIEKGTRVIIPLMAIQRDAHLFPEPEKFIPERFSPENKDNILPYSYMPFGEGPRYCIGKRMGLIQAKMGVALTLSRYKLLKSPQTPDKIKFEPTLLVLTSKTPIYLKLEKRDVR